MEILEFTTLITPLRDKLYRFALKMLGNEAEAEDNVQETFLRMWVMRQKLNEYNNLGGLAMQINKNLCLDKLRKQKTNTTIDSVYSYTDNSTAHSSLEIKQSIDIVGKIIKALPALQQIVIRMRDVEGYDIDEIASITATRPDAVRVNLSRARQKVREQYLKLVGN